MTEPMFGDAFRRKNSTRSGHPKTAVIITALELETRAVLRHLHNQRKETVAGSDFIVGDFEDWKIAVKEAGAGNVSAAATTTESLKALGPTVALFVGVAGGIKDVALGDVVFATKVYGYESGKELTGETRHRPNVLVTSYDFESISRVQRQFDNWRKFLDAGLKHGQPKVFVGPIVAGEKVVASTESATAQLFRQNYSDAIAVEMEAGGFLTGVRVVFPTQAGIVRGISDLLSGKEAADRSGSQERAADAASAFAFGLLQHLGETIDQATAWKKRLERLVVGLTSGALSAGLNASPDPYGSYSQFLAIAHPAPALCLGLGLSLVLRLSPIRTVLAVLSTYVAWQAAWFIGFSLAGLSENPPAGSLLLASMCGGYIGALLLNLFLETITWTLTARKAWRHLKTSVTCSILSGLTAVATILNDINLSAYSLEVLSTAYLLALFVPWQAYFVLTSSHGARYEMSLTRPQQMMWLFGSLLFTLFCGLPIVRDTLNQTKVDVPPIIALELDRPTRLGDGRTKLQYKALKEVGDMLRCHLAVKAGDGTVIEEPEFLLNVRSVQHEFEFLLAPANDGAEARLICLGSNVDHYTHWTPLPALQGQSQ